MAQLTKDLFQPWLDVTLGALPEQRFVRVDKSTVFELSWNPNTEDSDYIDQKNASTELKNYQPELPQEIVLDDTNPLYRFMDAFFEQMPTGSDCVVPFLLVKPDLATGQPTRGLYWPKAEVHPDTTNAVDGKLSFNIELNGDFQVGTAALTDGRMAFTPSEYATGVTVPDAAVSVAVGGSAALGAEPTGGDGFLVYASSNPSVASVDPDGTVRGVSAGSADVHVLCLAGGKRYTGTARVTVTAPAKADARK